MKKIKRNRRNFLSTTAKATAGVFVVPHFNINSSKPKLTETVIGHGDFRYKVHKEWGNLDPSKTPVNNCHEMVMDSKNRLIMVGDNTHNNVLIYDKSGKLLDSWGIRYKGGHGLSLWNDGVEDFLFICDTDGSMVKTTLDGRELMLLGHPSEYGAYKKEDPFKPTETAIGPNGDIYIADGYGSQYVLQFTKDGEFIRKIGNGRGTDKDQFQTAHGICIDYRIKTSPTLLITSRASNSFKRFTLDGNYLEEIILPGAFVCRPVIHHQNLYAGVCWSSKIDFIEGYMDTHPTRTNPNSGFVTILDINNKVVSNPGGTAPNYNNGKLQRMMQQEPVFHHCHDVCIDNDDNLYVCQWNANKAYPIKLERV
ncbi:6-bladed beta-propeller [Zobellia russellii]|uniref:6-bladed beta-propeller n=1 Tax=Zobellia russellii TaxID=248907 RepID=UPI001BFF6989|nr:6-bladed beta-propeller [Zobellia russellii]MBT9188274.1 6-bladed beta-propeller [Zobellia russellii]